MVKITLWNYTKTQTKVIRFSKEISLFTVPFIGAEINLGNDYYCVDRVIFDVNGNITAIVKDCSEMGKEEFIFDDSDLDEIIETMGENGWKILSNVDIPKYRQNTNS